MLTIRQITWSASIDYSKKGFDISVRAFAPSEGTHMGSLSLRERLIGAWELVSAVERDVETGVESNVLGERPRGVHPLYAGWIYVRSVARPGTRALRGREFASRRPRGVCRGGE